MSEKINFEDLSLIEKIDLFVQLISGHERESEINYMLALFTAYNLEWETAEEYGLEEHTTEDLIELFDNWLNGDEFGPNETFWNIALKDLGSDKIFSIIGHIKRFIAKYHDIMKPLDDLRHELLVMFTRMNSKDL